MSEKAAAAQKWAEAKSCLEAADQALALARAEYAKAEDAEFHAWQALEGLAGRTSLTASVAAVIEEDVMRDGQPFTERKSVTIQPSAMRHSLAQRPIG